MLHNVTPDVLFSSGGTAAELPFSPVRINALKSYPRLLWQEPVINPRPWRSQILSLAMSQSTIVPSFAIAWEKVVFRKYGL